MNREERPFKSYKKFESLQTFCSQYKRNSQPEPNLCRARAPLLECTGRT
jgi:hypothetical protein